MINKRKPTISFIITDYNIPEAMLQECVESVLAVNIPDNRREVILVDDGSATPPTATLERYGNRIRYFRQDNMGLSAARNAGINLAQGEYIQFVDGDDRLVPECYDTLVAQLESGTNAADRTGKATDNAAEADILMFRFTVEEHDKTATSAAKTLFRRTTGRRFLTGKNLRASACSYLFRREILGDLRFEDGIYHEDELFTPLLFCRAGDIILSSAAAYYYRQREASITNATEDRHIEKRFEDFFSVIMRLKGLSESAEYKVLVRRVDQLCMDFLYNVATITGDYGKFRDAASRLRASRLFPLSLRFYTLKYFCFSVLTRTVWGFRLVFKCMSRS